MFIKCIELFLEIVKFKTISADHQKHAKLPSMKRATQLDSSPVSSTISC